MSPNALWRLARQLCTLALLMGAAALPTWAQDDPPGRVGRLADLNGGVWRYDLEQGEWTAAERNRPLTSGDRLSTARDGRAELRIGSTVLQLSNSSELELLRVDDDKLVFQLHSGSLALRLRSREVAGEVELLTAEARLLPRRAGLYRLDRNDDTTWAGAWRGELLVDDLPGLRLADGQRLQLWREGAGRTLRHSADTLPSGDGFSAWVLAEEGRDERTVAARYVSPEMTGVEDLDRHGRWDSHPEYGPVWLPSNVQPGWAPYRDGRWVWMSPWGWTWVDNAPWGFAPFHYGRWVAWRGAWCWFPGAYVARPVYAPALVAWVGQGGWGVSVRVGNGPGVGWLPLAPREPFRPPYRHSPRYGERVNPGPPGRGPGGHGRAGPTVIETRPDARHEGRPDHRPAPRPELRQEPRPQLGPESRRERPEGPERPERAVRPDRPERPARPDSSERGDKPDKPDRPDKSDKPERPGPQAPRPAMPAAAPPVPPAPPPVAAPRPPERAERPAAKPERPERPREQRDNERQRRPEPQGSNRDRDAQR